jgi:hypothetical protein
MMNEINDIHVYFRNFQNEKQIKESTYTLEYKKTEHFCAVLSEFILISLDNGFCQVDSKDINLINAHTKDYFITAFTFLQHGIDNNAVIVLLEYLSALVLKKSDDISPQELLEIKILEKIIPMIQRFEIKNYLNTISNLCSGQFLYEIKNKFSKYIE